MKRITTSLIKSITHHLRVIPVALFFTFIHVVSISAQTPETIPSPISIANQIETQSLILRDKDKRSNGTLSEFINEIFEVQTSGDKDRFISAVKKLDQSHAAINSGVMESLVELFLNYAEMKDFENLVEANLEIKNYLMKVAKHEDWFVGFQANRLLALEQAQSQNSNNAIKTMQNALNMIPDDLSDEAINARISAVEVLAYLQNIKLNKDLALFNTQKLIDLKLEAGQPIDGIELLNNLMYSLTHWRDNEVRLTLAQTLKRLENKYGSTTPGLTNIHISRVYIDTGKYKKAIGPAKSAVAETKLASLKNNALLNLATAYAGNGDIRLAKKTLSKLPKALQNSGNGKYTQALLNLKEGNIEEALVILNERYDARVIRFLEENSQNTMEVLAALENTSERQAEREAALQREASLVRSQLEQQQNINKLLIALVALIGLTGVAALLFARHRHKLAKLLQVKTEEAESADRLKTEFLGMVSHELRTPLNGIIGIADVLAHQGPTETVRKRGNIILGSGQALFSMIESIIDMSRLESNKLELSFEPDSVKDIAQRQIKKWSDHAQEKEIIFTAHISDDLEKYVYIDSQNLEKCFETLISNAVKFTSKGRVHLHLTSEDLPNSSQTQFTFIVADTGMGMSEDVQSKLFKPFLQADSSITRKFGGAGLRLAISRSLARMMGGDIVVKSREGRGSEFILTFQAKHAEKNQIELGYSEALDAPDLLDLSVFKSTQPPKETALASIGKQDITVSQPKKPQRHIENVDQDQDQEHIILEDAHTLESDEFDILNLALDADQNWTENASVHENMTDLDNVRKVESATPDVVAPDFTKNIKNIRILLIEDTLSNQEVIYTLLQNEDMKCTAANSAQEGLKLLELQHFDMIIMDIRLPRMDGIEATRIIRQSEKSWANIPIIALTADATAENNAACMEVGMDAFLTKPILLNELQNVINFVLIEKQDENGNDSLPIISKTIAS